MNGAFEATDGASVDPNRASVSAFGAFVATPAANQVRRAPATTGLTSTTSSDEHARRRSRPRQSQTGKSCTWHMREEVAINASPDELGDDFRQAAHTTPIGSVQAFVRYDILRL